MPLRIGFDLDGVLADMDSELRRQADGLFRGCQRLVHAGPRRRGGRTRAPETHSQIGFPISRRQRLGSI